MALLRSRAENSKEYWKSLKTKKQLYDVFDYLQPYEEGTFNDDPEQPIYFKDNEFKEKAAKLKQAAAPLLPVLQDLVEHLPVTGRHYSIFVNGGNCESIASDILKDLSPGDPEGLAVVAWLILKVFDGKADNNVVDNLAAGLGVPEARAAYAAFKRYQVFKQSDAQRMVAFKQTQEYKKQIMEIRLGLRKIIELPAE